MTCLTSIEICAGGGGQALGLEQAGFNHLALVELDHYACITLKANRPSWNVLEMDLKNFSAKDYQGIDLLAGGVPCPPFSIAGKQLGKDDERNLFPEVIRIINECQPNAAMIENVRGLLKPTFDDYRSFITKEIEVLNYSCSWKLLQASDFGVSQNRARTVLVAIKKDFAKYFSWPSITKSHTPSVGEALYNEMARYGWKNVDAWKDKANNIAPTIVGGSKKHGGPDLGPTRARNAWANLGVDGCLIATEPPSEDFIGMPYLTVKMAAILQGFPVEWEFAGRKTPAYRQVGNAFPPPVAKAVGMAIAKAIKDKKKEDAERGVA
ncbi:modification methylase [Desulfosporosinus sp. Tol-M]|nr:modification methylase [Desulfosporosinus sp. Tol-M]